MPVSSVSAVTSYEQARRVVNAQVEADFCFPEGSLEQAFARSTPLLISNRLDLDAMAPHRRWWKGSHFEMRLGNYRGTTLLCAKHPRVLEELTKLLGGDAGNWVGDYSKLRKINDFLSPYTLQNSGTAIFYTPGKTLFTGLEMSEPAGYIFTHLSPEVIETFRGDHRFSNALGFSKDRPDVDALVAFADGSPVAIAGASQDSSLMRQIGVDVIEGHRQKGLATYLVTRLARETLATGYVPFYGTSPSHIISQQIALSAGFEPAWYEYVSTSLLDIEMQQGAAGGPEGGQ